MDRKAKMNELKFEVDNIIYQETPKSRTKYKLKKKKTIKRAISRSTKKVKLKKKKTVSMIHKSQVVVPKGKSGLSALFSKKDRSEGKKIKKTKTIKKKKTKTKKKSKK